MCSLQLARCRESTVLSRGTNSVHKVQCSHLLRRALSLGDHCSLKRYTILRSDCFFPVWKQLHGDTHMQAGFKRYSQKCRASCLSSETNKGLADFVAAAATRLKILMMVTQSQFFCRCAPPVGLMMFGLWGLLPLGRFVRQIIFQKNDRLWRESQTRNILTSYLRPLLLWSGVILLCRALDPLVLATEASQAIKQRFLNFVRSLSTVLAFAYCTSSLLQQLQKVMQDKQGSQDTRSVGAEFVGNTVYTAVWIGALCLFMELLGFSTQKWLTAGGLGTVLLTLAGREIFTNFLSSIMIHATRPFIVNEWIQTKIEGYEVSGTVEHVGWWSPTIVRGDDREAVHIPNHKFTVSVVRNLSQKSHWRIKTHFGISHLDASKITSIVADMRKVISKHPQVEQRRLHRRVFLESIDPENQALMVLISCFVKTPHFEEYLRVKETILLDLLKVISHHHARLATPIRSVQRLLDESDSRNSPFRDMSRSSDFNERPYLLIEATPLAGGRDGDPSPSTTPQAKVSDSSFTDTSRAGLEKSPGVATAEKPKDPSSGVETSSNSKLQLEGLDSMGLNVNDITLLGAAFEKPPASIAESECLEGVPDAEVSEEMGKESRVETSVGRPESSNTKVTDTMPMELDKINQEMGVEIGAGQGANQLKNVLSVSESEVKGAKDTQISQLQVKVELDFTVGTEGVDVRDTNVTQGAGLLSSRQGGDQTMSNSFSTSKSQTEENLVLGVALDGPKRILRLDDEDMFSSGKNEQKELVASRNGNNPGTPGKERREGREGLESPNAGLLESRDRP